MTNVYNGKENVVPNGAHEGTTAALIPCSLFRVVLQSTRADEDSNAANETTERPAKALPLIEIRPS